MSTYYTGKYLDKVPTGFGGYTGLVLTNSGNFSVTYTATISDTTLVGVAGGSIAAGANTNTLYISDTTTTENINDDSYVLTANPSESATFYVLHRPFTGFTAGNQSTGLEKATITIESVSSAGDSDLPIIVDITGQRVFDNPVPQRVGKFYAVKSYSESTAYKLNFHWNSLFATNYVKGFELGLYADSSFSTLVSSYNYNVPLSNDSNKPTYGDYNGFIDTDFSYAMTSLDIAQDYYARIRAYNFENEYGSYSYPTGYSYEDPILETTGVSGLYPSPGANLRSDATILYLSRNDDYEENFNIYSFMKQNNNNSSDFRRYSGVNIKFSSKTDSLCKYIATVTGSGGLNFVVPNTDSFRYAANASNIFTVELEFDNIAVLGKGGAGLAWKSDGTYIDAQNGGPCFNFDAYTYNGRSLEFRLYKDLNSVFYGGPGGSKGWLITDETTNNTNIIKLNGKSIENLDGIVVSELTIA